MTIAPTTEGGLSIEINDASEWILLGGITADAMTRENKLSHRLGECITDEEVVMDWLDFIVPELEAGFHADVLHVTTAIAAARVEAGDGLGVVVLARENLFHWYSALNQARLALEETYRFGPGENMDPEGLPSTHRAPFMRSKFYCAIQSLLLTVGMG